MREKVKSWVGSISPLLALIWFVKTFQNKTNLIKWRHLSFCLLPLLLKFLRGVLYLCQAHLKKLSLCLDLYFCIFTKPIFKIFVISKVVVVQNRCYRVPTQLRWPRESRGLFSWLRTRVTCPPTMGHRKSCEKKIFFSIAKEMWYMFSFSCSVFYWQWRWRSISFLQKDVLH